MGRREKRHEQNRIENDEKVENLLHEDESDSNLNRSKEWNLFVKEEDQEITKTCSKKWKVQEESVRHYYGEKAATK